MRILALETSCDETGAAVVEKKNNTIRVLSNVTATSLALHATTGGIIPESAAREQVKYMMPTIVDALLESKGIKSTSSEENFKVANKILKDSIDAIAVTYGPGLVGSLLVGVETAKTLSFSFNKPLIPVHHLLAHLYANFIQPVDFKSIKIPFPFIGLIVSGCHTDLLFFKKHGKFEWLGGTLDDAAGEALDKTGRLLGFPYPAGPQIERRAENGKNTPIKFTSPVIHDKRFDFSFSGLKAEVSRFVQKQNLTEELTDEICYATQKAIIDVLVKKTVLAAKKYKAPTILLGGGVSANNKLFEELKLQVKRDLPNTKVIVPQKAYTTDNAAMIGSYALLNYKPVPWEKITANPELYFS